MPKLLIFINSRSEVLSEKSQITHFTGVKLFALQSGCVKFWTNIMSAFCPLFQKKKLAKLLKCQRLWHFAKKYGPLHHLLVSKYILLGHLGTEWCNKRWYLTLGTWKQIKSVSAKLSSPQYFMRMTIYCCAWMYQFCLKGIFYQITISFKVTATSYKHTIWTTFQPWFVTIA